MTERLSCDGPGCRKAVRTYPVADANRNPKAEWQFVTSYDRSTMFSEIVEQHEHHFHDLGCLVSWATEQIDAARRADEHDAT